MPTVEELQKKLDDQAKALEALALRVQQLEDFVVSANAVNVLKNNLPPPSDRPRRRSTRKLGAWIALLTAVPFLVPGKYAVSVQSL